MGWGWGWGLSHYVFNYYYYHHHFGVFLFVSFTTLIIFTHCSSLAMFLCSPCPSHTTWLSSLPPSLSLTHSQTLTNRGYTYEESKYIHIFFSDHFHHPFLLRLVTRNVAQKAGCHHHYPGCLCSNINFVSNLRYCVPFVGTWLRGFSTRFPRHFS